MKAPSSSKFVLYLCVPKLPNVIVLDRCEWLGRLLCYVSVHCGESRASEILVHVIQGATNTTQVYVSLCYVLPVFFPV